MAVPALRSIAPGQRPHSRHAAIARACRRYAASAPVATTDAAGMVDALRQLQRCLDDLVRAGLERAVSAGTAEPLVRIPLGPAARLLGTWLQRHPERLLDPLLRRLAGVAR